VLQAQGKVDEAVVEYRDVLRTAADHPEAHYTLAVGLGAQDNLREAIPHYRRAIELRPSWPLPLIDLAYILAVSPDPEIRRPGEALTLARRALGLTTPPSLAAQSIVAAALAALGEFDRAIAMAESALPAARAAGNEQMVGEIGRQLEAYRQHKPLFAPR
jgi:tetratricopeptide (TPR) repeat protein